MTIRHWFGYSDSDQALLRDASAWGHGVRYGEATDTRSRGESSAAETQYDVPAVHAFLPDPSAQPLIDRLPAGCSCGICTGGLVAGRPAIAGQSRQQRKAHFPLRRRQEIEAVEHDPSAVLAQVREVADWLEENRAALLETNQLITALPAWHTAIAPHLG